MKLIGAIALVFVGLFFGACADHPCVHVRNPELAAQTGSAPSSAPQASATPDESAGKMNSKPVTSNTVLVYKADGSLQCGQGKGISIAEMEKELKGIKILSRDNRADGKMHIQLCGSPTGQINVFEISEKNLKVAEARGFKKL